MGRGVKKPVALVILDGWGIEENCDNNAVCRAHTPRLDSLFENYPSNRLGASGMDVGLPEGQMGNSEVGHLNIGAGRVVYQDFTRISKCIETGEFFENPKLLEAVRGAKERGGGLHLMGLLSDGGVHSHITHLYALVELARREGLERIFVHAFLDGRDTPPQSGVDYLSQLEEKLREMGVGKVATVTGRYYAMDRDTRWERVERAWKAMVLGEGIRVSSSREAIREAYVDGQTDEFVEPRVILEDGRPTATVNDGDAVIFFNFRSDRAREITRAFNDEPFRGFQRPEKPNLASYVCMTEYDQTFDLPVAFPPESHEHILGEVVGSAGLTQLRIAETEKYAHVTFFFNGGSEVPFPGEKRVLIPSPREVATYDQKPAMSAPEVTDKVVECVEKGDFDLIVLNYANPDMVGHTGVFKAAVSAMETVDQCVGRVVDSVLKAGGVLLITSDHGNCEKLADEKGGPHTAHTSNPVPIILVGHDRQDVKVRPGILADIAPTILDLMNLEKPAQMTGASLLES